MGGNEDGIANEEIEERIRASRPTPAPPSATTLVGAHMRQIEKSFMLQTIDLQWREHLMHIDHLRTVIGLRGYGQRDPLNEFKTEAFTLFEKLLVDLRQNVTRWLMTVEFAFEEAPPLPAGGPTFEVHLDPFTGENELERGYTPDSVSADQRAALPMSALPDGWQDTAATSPAPAPRARSSSTARRPGLTTGYSLRATAAPGCARRRATARAGGRCSIGERQPVGARPRG